MKRFVYRLKCGTGFASLDSTYDIDAIVTVIEWEIPFMDRVRRLPEMKVSCPHCKQMIGIPVITDGSSHAYGRNNLMPHTHSVTVIEKSEPVTGSYSYTKTLEDIVQKAKQETGNRKYMLVHVNDPTSSKLVNCSAVLPESSPVVEEPEEIVRTTEYKRTDMFFKLVIGLLILIALIRSIELAMVLQCAK